MQVEIGINIKQLGVRFFSWLANVPLSCCYFWRNFSLDVFYRIVLFFLEKKWSVCCMYQEIWSKIKKKTMKELAFISYLLKNSELEIIKASLILYFLYLYIFYLLYIYFFYMYFYIFLYRLQPCYLFGITLFVNFRSSHPVVILGKGVLKFAAYFLNTFS